MVEHILSLQEISDIEKELKFFSEDVSNACEHLEIIIKGFDSQGVVQSLYQSGNFGKENQERLQNCLIAIRAYLDSINGDGALVPVTRKFLQEQESRVQSGS